jgi:hypothetical protein
MLIVIGIAAFVVSPWSEFLFEGATYAITIFFGLALDIVYTPLGAVNPALAYAFFIVSIVLVLVVAFLIPGRIYSLIQRGTNIFDLEPEESSDKIDDETIEEENNRSGHEVKT